MNVDYKASPTISAFMASNARHRFILGPFGSGKTVGASIMEVVRRAGMQRPSPIDGKRKTRIAIIRNTAPQLTDTVIRSFHDWFPPGTLGIWKLTGKTYSIRQGDIECDILFRALDDASDVSNLLSLELTMAELSEFREQSREIVEGLDGRIGRYPSARDGGATFAGIFGDSNMPAEGSWWERMLNGRDPEDGKKEKPNGWEVFIQPPAMLRQVDGSYLPNPLAENVENLPENYYLNLVTGKSDDYIRTYVLCEYGRSLGGKPVHPMFNKEVHVSKTRLVPNPNNLLLVSADFGLTPAIILKQQDAFGRVLTLDNIATFGMGLERAIETRLLPLLRQKYDACKDIFVTGDPSGGRSADGDEVSCADVFARYKKKGLGKIKFAWSNNPVHRQNATDHFLSTLVDRGMPAYQIDPGCDWLIAALGGKFQFKKYKDGRENSEVEKNDWSHTGEANQYGDMYYERGGRRKAEKQVDQLDWAELRGRQSGHSGNSYNTPR